MIIETAQSHVQKGLLTKQMMGPKVTLESKHIELPKGEIILEDVNNPVSINGHLLKGLIIAKR